jgi:hypothetical protein
MEKITRVDNGDAVREILERKISYTLFYGKQVSVNHSQNLRTGSSYLSMRQGMLITLRTS